MRPWVILWEHKSTKIFCYPIAPSAGGGRSPAEVARVYKALGDEAAQAPAAAERRAHDAQRGGR